MNPDNLESGVKHCCRCCSSRDLPIEIENKMLVAIKNRDDIEHTLTPRPLLHPSRPRRLPPPDRLRPRLHLRRRSGH